MDWASWRKGGHDEHSVVADPRFVDLAGRDFRLTDVHGSVVQGIIA